MTRPGPNRPNGAEAFVRMLELHQVEVIFGLCGDTSLPLYDALYRLDHGIRHVLTRDERSAAYMADAYARVTGKVGVCEGPSGGGATHILPGVVEANESSIPILAVTTDIAVASRGKFTLTELDQAGLFRPLTKWNAMVDRAEDVPKLIRTAFTQMCTGRPGAVHLGLPFDVQQAPLDQAEIWADPALGRYPARPGAPDPDAVAAAAELFGESKSPLIVCGGGVINAGGEAELLALAEARSVPVATTISGKGSLPECHPLAVGVVGSNGGTPETRAIVDAADLVVVVGCRAGSVTTEHWRHPVPGGPKIIHLDADPTVIGATYRADAALVGDARLGLSALNAALDGQRPEAVAGPLTADVVARAKAEKFTAFRALAASEETPIRPERIVAEVQSALPDDAVVSADPGTPCPYFAAYYELARSGRHFISNRAHGALGYALPASIGAQIGRPDAKVVAVMGDGSFGFACGELETVVRLNLPITFVVISNATFGWIMAGQRSGFEERYFSVDFSRTDHAKVAEGFGVKAWRVTDPAALGGVFAQAAAHDGPSLVDVIAQPLHEARAPVSEWVA